MKNIINNSWTVTIVGTTLGVLIAFVLNNWKETYQEKARVDSVLKQIKLEVTQNRDNLQKGLDSSDFVEAYYDVFQFVKGDSLIMNVSEKVNYLDKYQEVAVSFKDSTLINNDVFSYAFEMEGDLSLDINPVNTGNVSWKLAQNIGVVQSIDFELLKKIEDAYGAQELVQKRDEKLLEYLEKPVESYEGIKALFYSVHQNREFQQQLIEAYNLVLKEF